MKAVDPTMLAVSLMQQCLNGFRDEHHHKGWKKKWRNEIDALPPVLCGAVWFAWEQATQASGAPDLEKPGVWTQGPTVPRRSGKHCAWTAIYDTSRETGLQSRPALDVFATAVGNRSVFEWNDTPGRTQAEVLAAFTKAIELAERSNG